MKSEEAFNRRYPVGSHTPELLEYLWEVWEKAVEWKEKELLLDNKNTYTLQLHDD